MPILAAMFVTLFAGFAAFFVQAIGKKFAFGLVLAAMYTAMTLALFVAMRATIGGLANATSLSGIAAMFFGAALPPVAPACISAIVTTWTGCALYKWKVKALDVFAKS